MSRAVSEWIATHDDQDIPKRVKLRIWEREGGRCYLTGAKSRPGDVFEFEHVIALRAGGGHRESNIRLALTGPHKVKTADDRQVIAKVDRISAKHRGLWPKSRHKLQGRGFVAWWQDYIRALLADAHDHYVEHLSDLADEAALPSAAVEAGGEGLRESIYIASKTRHADEALAAGWGKRSPAGEGAGVEWRALTDADWSGEFFLGFWRGGETPDVVRWNEGEGEWEDERGAVFGAPDWIAALPAAPARASQPSPGEVG